MMLVCEKVDQSEAFAPELVVFDLDGTLIEFHKEFLFSETSRITPTFAHYDENSVGPIDRDRLEACFSEFDYFRFVCARVRDEFIQFFWESFDWQRFPTPKPLPGACEMLECLSKRGVRLALATARLSSQEKLESELRDTGFLNFLSRMAFRESESVHWTDKTDMLLSICDELDVCPNNAVMVGDIPPDIRSAKEAGFGYTVAVRSGGLNDDVLKSAGPNAVIDDVRQLAELLAPTWSG